MTTAHTPDPTLALAAATAAAGVLPSVTPLSAVATQPGNEHVTNAFAGAAIASLEGSDGRTHRAAVLVGNEFVRALAESPLGGLDLPAATQPALDALAAALGCTARAATAVELAMVPADLGGPFTAVPLVGQGIEAAVLIGDSALVTAVAAVPSTAEPTAVFAPAGTPLGDPLSGPLSYGAPTPVPSFDAAPRPALASQRGIEMLAGVDMEVTVELGRTRMAVRDLLALAPGAVLELDRAADGPADLLVNGRLIARGEVVVIDEDFGLRITEIVDDAGA
ncbi:flagellar motor switch protein FliN [Nocardioides campestrisoli]|uniref:flagellar motor switch protein FliN n=1 Tax=Nocardioides campestrisoli TaxID=2736757 RepID=UPI0015E7AB27|nr:flagellar motor switch protein FliN [Nocardioides campestrisoli]